MPSAAYPDDEFPFQLYAVHNGKTEARRPEDLRYAIRLSKEITRISRDFDAIVPQTFIPIFSSFLSRIKVPVVPIVHDVYQPLPLISGIAAWREFQDGSTLRGLEGCMLERACLWYASTCPIVLTVSDSSYEKLQQWIPRNKIRITGNGVFLDEFTETTKDIDVICIGRFDAPYKNIDVVCEALSDTDIQTIIVGDGKLRPSIERRYQSENIQFTGYISEAKKRELLSRSKILVSASSIEGFGIALLEGLASGCVVAASDIGPHRFVDQGSNVITFFPVGDSNAIRATIVELLRLPDSESANIRKRGRALVTKYWQWHTIAHKTEVFVRSGIELYEAVRQ
jgi:glycosyltransferase involved in cell wall biosynthesis